MGTGDAGRSGIRTSTHGIEKAGLPGCEHRGRPLSRKEPLESIHVVLRVVHVELARRRDQAGILDDRLERAHYGCCTRLAAEPKRWMSVTAPPWPSSALSPARSSRCRVSTRCTTCSTGVTSPGCDASRSATTVPRDRSRIAFRGRAWRFPRSALRRPRTRGLHSRAACPHGRASLVRGQRDRRADCNGAAALRRRLLDVSRRGRPCRTAQHRRRGRAADRPPDAGAAACPRSGQRRRGRVPAPAPGRGPADARLRLAGADRRRGGAPSLVTLHRCHRVRGRSHRGALRIRPHDLPPRAVRAGARGAEAAVASPMGGSAGGPARPGGRRDRSGAGAALRTR